MEMNFLSMFSFHYCLSTLPKCYLYYSSHVVSIWISFFYYKYYVLSFSTDVVSTLSYYCTCLASLQTNIQLNLSSYVTLCMRRLYRRELCHGALDIGREMIFFRNVPSTMRIWQVINVEVWQEGPFNYRVLAEIGASINNHFHNFLLDMIIHPCHNFNCDLADPRMNSTNGCVIPW